MKAKLWHRGEQSGILPVNLTVSALFATEAPTMNKRITEKRESHAAPIIENFISIIGQYKMKK